MIIEIFRECSDCKKKWKTYQKSDNDNHASFGFDALPCPKCNCGSQKITWKERKGWREKLLLHASSKGMITIENKNS